MSLKRFRDSTSNSTSTNPNESPGQGKSVGKRGRILYEAVVTNFFSNPSFDLEQNPPNDPDKTYAESMEKGVNQVKNTSFIRKMPRSSVSAIVVSDREGWKTQKSEIFYPLFPHLTMPVKPGEKIWIIYDTINREKSRRGYWIGRISSNINIDDQNYTHLDREFLYSSVGVSTTSALDAASGGSSYEDTDIYSFIAGAGNRNNNTLPGSAPYDSIVSNSMSYVEQFNGEPVPRFSPRVGDFILEGSNNTLISLGQDRPSLTGPVDESGIKGIGTIDIVVGRGQSESTAPAGDPIELEKRGENLDPYSETNKWPQFQDTPPNEGEGNPDFATDLSRVYVSMKTNGDANFGLASINSLGSTPEVSEAPYIIGKSTEIRLVSRDGGSIRMIKEGDAQAEICIASDGKIVIEGTNSARSAQKVIRGEDLAKAVSDFSTNIASAMIKTFGNMGGMIVDGGIASSCSTLAADVELALSSEVFIK